jgi:NAD(P)-dependent dehydrogenase (short-subunit alcohol dehydrogenase family)
MEIKEKAFVISGGASGLGFATAEMLIHSGAKAILLDINETLGQEAEAKLGPHALFIHCDITSEEQVENAISLAKSQVGSLHGIINCAGLGPAKRVVGKEGPHPLEDFQKIIQVNLIGTFNTLRLVANEMQHNEWNVDGERGIVINTASVAAFDGQVGQAAYSASKGGIVAMTLPIAREFARMGIRVNCIAPGIFETPLLKNLSQEVQDSLAQQIPFPKRLGKPVEFAQLVKQIIENTMLNGEVVRLDGGIRMN